MNPYEKLGVAPDAKLADIKKAYRELSKMAHPDMAGGDREIWEELVLAYEILSDPVRRKKFDETGIDEQSRITPAMIRANLRNAIQYMMPEGPMRKSPPGLKFLYKDPLTRAIDRVRGAIQVQEDRIVVKELEREELMELKIRLATESDDDVLGSLIQERLDEIDQSIKQEKDTIELANRSIEVLEKYTYKGDLEPEGHQPKVTPSLWDLSDQH